MVILEFGYTFCEDVCPVTLAHLTEVYKKLGSAARDVQLIYVTVDPERDNPERLREHLTAFNPSFLGATGTPDELQAVQKAYGVVAKQVVSRNQALPIRSGSFVVPLPGRPAGKTPRAGALRYSGRRHRSRSRVPVEDGCMMLDCCRRSPGRPSSRRRRSADSIPNASSPALPDRRRRDLHASVFAAMWPVTFDSREELFEIPKGTWARRMAGEKREILPSEIHLVVGIHNVLKLKNSDDVPQIFGPTLLMPGQTLRIPFTRPSENFFACTAHASGQARRCGGSHADLAVDPAQLADPANAALIVPTMRSGL